MLSLIFSSMKIGDKIKCLESCHGVTLNKSYCVVEIFGDNLMSGLVTIINDYGFKEGYKISRFITLREERKNKIQKLNCLV